LRFRQAAAGALLAVVCCGGAQAEFPDRPVRLVVPFAPGGANDSVARLISDRLSKILGQPMVVENRPGGGTLVGTNSVATAAPDGSTLLLISPAHTINPYINKNLPYRTLEDFTPIGQITRAAYVMVTAAASPFKTIRDFAKPDHPSVTFASAGAGSAPHLAAQLFVSSLGIKYVHVPYQGGAPAMVGVIRGDVDFYFSSVAGARSFLNSNQVRALAVSSDYRVKALPDVPTVAEAGVPGFAINGWYGVIGPAHLPTDVVAKLHKAIEAALRDPELIAQLEQQGEEASGGTPEQFGALLRNDYDKYRTVVASSGLQPK
jgi:tripartite-type tricarboxylate transporter receptor subunit TctC